MTYTELDLPLGGSLYIASSPQRGAWSLADYRMSVKALLEEISRATGCDYGRLAHYDSGAPYLVKSDGKPLEKLQVSISHSGGYVALAIAEGPYGIGVDLQVASDKLPQIAPRFMSSSELNYYHCLIAAEEQSMACQWLYTVWGLKEAAYKAHPLQVKRSLATNYIISSQNAGNPTNTYNIYVDEGGSSYVDEGGASPTLLTGYLLRSITTAPYHLTFVQGGSVACRGE